MAVTSYLLLSLSFIESLMAFQQTFLVTREGGKEQLSSVLCSKGDLLPSQY